MQKRTLISLVAAIAMTLATAMFTQAYARTDTIPAHLKTVLQQRFGHPVSSVTKSPVAGLYEVSIGPQIIYSDASGDYFLVGDLIQARTGRNLTEEHLNNQNRVGFSSLPFDNAVKVVHGNGSRKIAVFSDPNCPYCRVFENTLKSVNNVTVYTFLYPVLSADSMNKARAIWCSPDRAKAWSAWILGRRAPTASGNCNTSAINANLALGKRFNVTGTPTIILPNGHRLPGAVPLDELNRELAALH